MLHLIDESTKSAAIGAGMLTCSVSFVIYIIIALVVLLGGLGYQTGTAKAGAGISLLPLAGILCICIYAWENGRAIIGCICALLGFFPFLGGILLVSAAADYGRVEVLTGTNGTTYTHPVHNPSDGKLNVAGTYACGIIFIIVGFCHCLGCWVSFCLGLSGNQENGAA